MVLPMASAGCLEPELLQRFGADDGVGTARRQRALVVRGGFFIGRIGPESSRGLLVLEHAPGQQSQAHRVEEAGIDIVEAQLDRLRVAVDAHRRSCCCCGIDADAGAADGFERRGMAAVAVDDLFGNRCRAAGGRCRSPAAARRGCSRYRHCGRRSSAPSRPRCRSSARSKWRIGRRRECCAAGPSLAYRCRRDWI